MPVRDRWNPWRLVAVVVLLLALGAWLVSTLATRQPGDVAEFGWTVEAHRIFNLIEGLVWLAVAAALFWKARRKQVSRPPASVAGIFFVLFGMSDFIEIWTGSWFEPAWLLAWNVACVVGLLACLAWHRASTS